MKKFYILIRKDLKLSIGKILAHVGHLCTEMAWDFLRNQKNWALRKKFTDWYIDAQQTKIFLEVKDLEELRSFWNNAILQYGYLTWEIADAGFTNELEQGIIVMMGIEPLTDKEAESLGLKKLRLYKYE